MKENKYGIDLNSLKSINNIVGDDDIDTVSLNNYADKARNYLMDKKWCLEIKNGYFGFGIGKIIGIFLYEIIPLNSEIDDFIWVIVGDIPPAYLSPVYCKTIEEVLNGYINEMNAWADAVLNNEGIDDLIPVNAPPSIINAQDIKKRMQFLRTEVIEVINDNDT